MREAFSTTINKKNFDVAYSDLMHVSDVERPFIIAFGGL